MTFYSEMERIIKEQGEKGLDLLEHYAGIELELYRDSTDDVYSRVHGHVSGSEGELIKEFIGVLQSDDFAPSNDAYSGNFEVGFLYTKDKDVKIGDVIKIKSVDKKNRRFKIVEIDTVGLTLEIFKSFKLSNLGD